MYKHYLKPAVDFILSLIALVILSPVLLVLILIQAFINKGKIFFIQERPGKDAQLFRLIKFRTMIDKVDEKGVRLPDHMRITRFGKLLRNFSLDELPQLVNVIKGDMSIVGPRPLLKEYIPLYNPGQARRHEVKPGLTGWTQVNGRNNLSWQEKFELDIYYVDNISLFLDIRIILSTIKSVFLREGINSSTKYTMPVFKGNNN